MSFYDVVEGDGLGVCREEGAGVESPREGLILSNFFLD